MSHAKERKEKNCLNCNAVVAGRFCQVCGQENVEIHETFGHLAGHLLSDLFHFDGMFFSTSRYLLFTPGFLTHEYMRGRRASYLNPIKMYVFISAIFFLFFLTVYKPEVNLDDEGNKDLTAKETMASLRQTRNELDSIVKDKEVPEVAKMAVKGKLALVDKNIALLEKDTTHKKELLAEVNKTYVNSVGTLAITDSGDYHSAAQYDSMQQKLPADKRDGWFKRRYEYKNIALEEAFRKDSSEAMNNLLETIEHHFPQVLFISLPLFALVLQALYVRRKAFHYGNHLIYTVHLYSAVFIFLFLILVINQIDGYAYLGWTKWLSVAIFLYTVYYTLAGMHSYYEQGWGKTIVKWLILNIAGFFIMMVLFMLLFFFAIYAL